MEDFRNSFKGSNFFAPLFRRWIKLCYGLGDIIITPTPYSKALLQSYGLQKPVYALSNGVDTDFFAPSSQARRRFREKYQLAGAQKAVLSVGHFIQRKGILDFIALAKRMPGVRFFWFGFTNPSLIPRQVQQAIAAAPENLIFPGYVSRDELRDAYCGCDLFDFLSYEETEGIVVLEALACGIPTIVRDIPVYADWLQTGKNVYKAEGLEQFFSLSRAVLSGELPSLAREGLTVARRRGIRQMGIRLVSLYETLPQKAPRAKTKAFLPN